MKNHYGWYIGASVYKPRTYDRALSVTSKGYGLAIGLVPLGDYRETDLPSDLLYNLRTNLNDARANGIKYIMRFRYALNAGEDDAPTQWIVKHIEQLGLVMNDYADVIHNYQAGFIGAWGEWNRSTYNDSAAARGKVLSAMLANSHPNTIVSLRTPMFAHELLGRYIHPYEKDRMGIYHDCFMSSNTDQGSDSGTYEKPNVDYWKDYCQEFALFGGETCRPSERTANPSLVYREMKHLNVSYLNDQYRQEVLADWEYKGVKDIFLDVMRENSKEQ